MELENKMKNLRHSLMQTKDPLVFNNPTIIIEKGGYQYRTYDETENFEAKEKSFQYKSAYTDNEELMINCGEIEDYEIKITKSGKFLTEIHAANYFIPFIIGNKGSRKKEIEISTRTTIKLPKSEAENIKIYGHNERDVASARNRINMIILELRDKHKITHFISVRVFSNIIKESFELFKEAALNAHNRGIHPSIFQKPEKFHLTLAPLVLLDDVEIDTAINALHDCKTEIIKPLLENVEPPLCIEMKGVEIMNDDPTEVDILYGNVNILPNQYHSIFQSLVDKIVDHFYHKGFIRKQYESVKLHVTLMNTLFRKNGIKQENDGKRETFDASFILNNYKNYYFGVVDLDFIHLSVRFGKTDNSGDYYYEALTTVPFF